MAPTAEQGRIVAGRLMAAAAELIAERGWGAVSTRTVAERAGVSSSVVHYHFPSVQALLRQASLAGMRTSVEQVGMVLSSTATAAATLEAMLAAIGAFTGTDPASRLAMEAYLAASRDEELRDGITQVLDDFKAQLAQRFRIQQVADPDATAAVVAATLDGLLLHRGLGAVADPEAAATVLHRLIDRT